MKQKLKEIRKEFKKIIWPKAKDVFKSLAIVLAGIALIACLSMVVDAGTNALISLIR